MLSFRHVINIKTEGFYIIFLHSLSSGASLTFTTRLPADEMLFKCSATCGRSLSSWTGQIYGDDGPLNASFRDVLRAPTGCTQDVWATDLTPGVGCVGKKVTAGEGFPEEEAYG